MNPVISALLGCRIGPLAGSLVVADAADLVTGLRDKRDLLYRRVRVRPGPHIGDFTDLSLGCRPHNLLAESQTVHVFGVRELPSLVSWMGCLDSVGGVGAEHVKIAILKTSLALAVGISSPAPPFLGAGLSARRAVAQCDDHQVARSRPFPSPIEGLSR
jgi:hypothetical protein